MGGIFGGGGDDAADASIEAAEISAQSQREALDYLREKERVPSFYSEQALGQLAGFYGLPQAPTTQQTTQPQFIANPLLSQVNTAQTQVSPSGAPETEYDRLLRRYQTGGVSFEDLMAAKRDRKQIVDLGFSPGGGLPADTPAFIANPNYVEPGSLPRPLGQQGFIDQVQQNPFYGSMLEQGEEAILRNASATGGLRSGTANENLAQNNQNILQGLVNQKLSGLKGFTGSSGLEGSIASTMAGIGQTQGQGIAAAGQARADAQASQTQGLIGLAGVAASFFSDKRLKEGIEQIGTNNGHNIYSWTWNSIANDLGLEGESTGVMADEIMLTNPEAVITHSSGYKAVDYNMIGVI